MAVFALVLLVAWLALVAGFRGYLLRVHGDAYRRYASRTGRFLPFVGRLRDGA